MFETIFPEFGCSLMPMEDFDIIYTSIVRFKDKIPIFTYSVKLDSELKEKLVRSLNVFFQSSSIGAFPGGKEILPFENGIIYSIYNKNLSLIYVAITQRDDISDHVIFAFIEECMDHVEEEIDFRNIDRVAKNKYSRTFLGVYEELIRKYKKEPETNVERIDKKVVRVLSTISKGIQSTLRNKESLSKLQSRMTSLTNNVKLFKETSHNVKKSMLWKQYKVMFYAIVVILLLIILIIFIKRF